jgi:hypothetical protein
MPMVLPGIDFVLVGQQWVISCPQSAQNIYEGFLSYAKKFLRVGVLLWQ